MIEAHRLSKRFGPVRALRDVSFKTRRGTITAMLGENGAGKTTTLKIVLGFLRPDSGIVLVAPAPAAAGNAKNCPYLQNLVAWPDLLVVDEPFSALDPPSIKCVRDVFCGLRDAGKTVLLGSPLLAEVERIADGFIVLRRGSTIAHAGLREWRLLRSVRTAPDLESVFLRLARSWNRVNDGAGGGGGGPGGE